VFARTGAVKYVPETNVIATLAPCQEKGFKSHTQSKRILPSACVASCLELKPQQSPCCGNMMATTTTTAMAITQFPLKILPHSTIAYWEQQH
jgi:hypothetical protein